MPSHIQNNFAGNVFASLSFSGLLFWHLVIIPISLSSATYFADWSSIGSIGRDDQPLCVDIPSNMSLCKNIGYTKMRLPNLLDHDTLQEASQQAASWIPLLNVKCHEDTQLFLCSLFAPVSLDNHTIYSVLKNFLWIMTCCKKYIVGVLGKTYISLSISVPKSKNGMYINNGGSWIPLAFNVRLRQISFG